MPLLDDMTPELPNGLKCRVKPGEHQRGGHDGSDGA
jgi:hypothetical protein